MSATAESFCRTAFKLTASSTPIRTGLWSTTNGLAVRLASVMRGFMLSR